MKARLIGIFMALLGIAFCIVSAPAIAAPYIAASFVILALQRDDA